MIVTLPKVGNVEFPDNLSPEQFDNLVGRLAEKYDFSLPKPDVGLGEIAKRGFMRSLGETGIALGDTIPAMVSSFVGGDKEYAERQMKEAETSRQLLQQKYPTRFKSYKDINSPFEAIEYGAETLGELTPTVATSIIPGVGAEIAGSRLAGGAAFKAATAAGVPTRAGLAGVETAAKAGAKKGMYGGVFMGSFAQNAPEVFENIYQETGKFEPGVAALAGGFSAVLDSVLPVGVLNSLGSYGKLKVIEQMAKESGAAPKVWKYLGKEVSKSAASEGLTESAQEAIGAYAAQVAGSTKGLLDPENVQKYKEAFVKGAVGGAGFGIPGGIAAGRTAKKDYANTQEAKEALNQLAAQEEAARLQPTGLQTQIEGQFPTAGNTQADMEAALAENDARKAREIEINALQARMDEQRPGSRAYADLEDAIKKAKAKDADENAAKASESAFATAKPTPGTGGMFMPGVEKQRVENKISQEQGMRGFAFGDMGAQNAPKDPVTVQVLKALRISDRSQLGLSLLGTDMSTPEGVRKFIQTMEDPQKTGTININEDNYQKVLDSLYAEGRGGEVEAARAELQAEPISEKTQKQQSATRQFAFGDNSAGQPNTPTNRAGTSVAASSDQEGTAAGTGAPTRTRVVSPKPDARLSAVREAEQSATVTGEEALNLINQIDTNGGLQNKKITNYVKNNSFDLETIPASALPDLETLADKDDPYNRVLDPDENKISEYKKRLAANETAPPIVMDANGVILDGFHRAIAAQELGLPIQAYVAKPQNAPDTAKPTTNTALPVVSAKGRKATPIKATEAAPTKTVEAQNIAKVNKTIKFGEDLKIAAEKLGRTASLKGMTELAKDAHAYFSKVLPELALKAIANDLVYQPTAYRNSKMKSLKGAPEMTFGTQAEAEFFKGQGGKHAKNAAQWVRQNLSPEATAFMDKWIAQYEKENASSQVHYSRIDKQQGVKKATKKQLADEAKEAAADKKKVSVQKTIDDIYLDDVIETSYDDFVNRGRGEGYFASQETAALHGEAHPVVLHMLERGDVAGALQALADSGSSGLVQRIAGSLVKYLGDVNLAVGEARYDPKTNTIYLPANASEYEILHEAAHAALSHVLANPSHPITKKLNKLFEQIKGDIEGAYGATDLQEFAAEMWSNEVFRTRLKEMRTESPNLSMWDKIVNVLRKLFGYEPKQTSVTDAVDQMLNAIMGAPPAARYGESMYAQSIHKPNVAQQVMAGMGNIISNQPAMSSERAVKFLAATERMGISFREATQRFLNLSALGEVGEKILGKDSMDFARSVDGMIGYREELRAKLKPIADRLNAYRQNANYDAWSRLVHESSRLDVNPEAPISQYKGSPEKEAAHRQFSAEFNKLNAEEKQLYRDTFGAYRGLFKELKASLYSSLKETFPDEQAALSAYNKIIDQITKMGIDHYVPLYRQGTYWLTYTDKTGDAISELYNSQAERDFARRKLEADGNTNFDEFSRIDQFTVKNVPRGTMAAQIVKIMREGNADEDAVNKFLQLIVAAMPEASLLKSFQTRKGTLGYSNDVALAFGNVTQNVTRQLALMRYGDRMRRLVSNMKETAAGLRGRNQDRAVELINEFEARQEYAMNPKVADWARYASTGSFYFNLAGNASSAVVNTLQTPMIVYPLLSGKYGWANSGRALLAALKLYSGSGAKREVTDINGNKVIQDDWLEVGPSIDNAVSMGKAPQYAALMQRLKDLGFLQTSTAYDALDVNDKPGKEVGKTSNLAHKTAVISTYMFHHAERMNREVTAVAAYELEMERLKKKGITGDAAQAQAIEEAIKMVTFAHGAGHTESGPSIGHSDIGKVLTVFKRFGFTMYYMLFNTMNRALPVAGATGQQLEEIQAARRQLLGIYGVSALFAGVKGLPMYWIVEAAYNALNDDDEDDFDTVMRKYLGEFAFKGPVNYITNLGIADRVGWTDLIYRENKGGKADASAASQIMEAILGAPYAIGNNMFRAAELANDGHMERAIETALPIALRNVFKGIRYATEGVNTLRGDPVMGDVNGYNAAMQVLGFAPADLLAQYEINAIAKKQGEEITKQEQSLLKKYYVAQREGDFERADKLEEKLFELGDKYPELKITGNTLNKSVKARDKISEDMYHGVQLNKKLRPLIEQSIRELED